jgi:hypothetical protein
LVGLQYMFRVFETIYEGEVGQFVQYSRTT